MHKVDLPGAMNGILIKIPNKLLPEGFQSNQISLERNMNAHLFCMFTLSLLVAFCRAYKQEECLL